MKQFPFQTRMEVLDLYLQGLSGDKVSEKTGVSKGAVVSIIKDAREGKYPEMGLKGCLLYTSPSPRDLSTSRMPSSA